MTKESYNFGVDTEAKRLYTKTSGMTTKRFTLSEVGCYRTSLIVDDGRKMGNTEVVECLNNLHEENEQLKKELFETSKELLWATSDDVDRALYFENEVEDLRKEIFE